jgi:osmoprotectant transport system substrate-binding protein
MTTMARRAFAAIAGASLVVGAISGCGDNRSSQTASPSQTVLRVASYDFSENQVLAEVYAQALRRSGLSVDVITGIGPREIVEPALEQGRVDFVVDYLGTALDFLAPGNPRTHDAPASVHAALSAELRPRGLVALDFASAQDQNGFVVTSQYARSHQISRLSDLGQLAAGMTFGGPPECPTRRYCLRGLADTYSLHFKAFREIPTRAATATALASGEIDIGLLETTDPRLAGGDLQLLVDDRSLQPKENVVALVRNSALQAPNNRLRAVTSQITSLLTTQALVELNRDVEMGGKTPAQAASDWLKSAILASANSTST